LKIQNVISIGHGAQLTGLAAWMLVDWILSRLRPECVWPEPHWLTLLW